MGGENMAQGAESKTACRGRPSWFSHWLPYGRYNLLQLRARAILAAAFAEGSYRYHPSGDADWQPIARAVRRIASLYIQAKAVALHDNADAADLPPMKFAVRYGADTSPPWAKQFGPWRNSDQDPQLTIPFTSLGREINGEQEYRSSTLQIFYNEKSVPEECGTFLRCELEYQLNCHRVMLDIQQRPGMAERIPESLSERLWDLRIRVSDFLRRFVSCYRLDLNASPRWPDPFLVFFVSSRKSALTPGHIRSGLFGHSYIIDQGQREYLQARGFSAKIFNEYLPFPDGLCTEVYLSGECGIRSIKDVFTEYGEGIIARDGELKKLEETLLNNRTLLEMPIYHTGIGDHDSDPDGPEYILCIAVPGGSDGDATDTAVAQNGASVEATGSEKRALQLDAMLEAPRGSGFQRGECQVVVEMGKRLVARYLTIRSGTTATTIPLVGRSDAIRNVHRLIEAAAKTPATVLILGETGTGKELAARALHYLSTRNAEVFVPVNCANISVDTAESELFGHKKGSFTGANDDHCGLFESAHGGTIFLDEVGELDPKCQAKLLRVLDQREVLPKGETRPRKIDVRVIAATHRDLRAVQAENTFREDLFHRLNVFPIKMPPLRERKEDIEILLHHFLDIFARDYGKVINISEEATAILKEEDFPGNVRDLRNRIERAYILTLAQGNTLIGAQDVTG
jgi:Sigma-54 interaction domain